jgi:hypothetical protein
MKAMKDFTITSRRYFRIFVCGHAVAERNETGITVSSVYHLASLAYWPLCRLKAATELNESSFTRLARR